MLSGVFTYIMFMTEEGLGKADLVFMPVLVCGIVSGFLAWVVRMAGKLGITKTWRNIHNLNLLLIIISMALSIYYTMNL